MRRNKNKNKKIIRAKGGVLDMETEIVSGLTAYGAAYGRIE